MTTDDVRRIIDKWHQKRNAWPTRDELVAALLTAGFTVDFDELDNLLHMLRTVHEVQIINDTFAI